MRRSISSPSSSSRRGRSCGRSGSKFAAADRRSRSTDADLIVLSPGVPADLRLNWRPRARAASASSAIWNWRAGILQGDDHRHHRLERQDDHHRADRPYSAAERHPRAGGRQHRHAAGVDGRDARAPDNGTCWSFRASNSKRSTLSRADRRRASMSRRIIWTATTPSRTTPPRRRACSKRRQPGDFAVLNADDPICVELRGARRRRRCVWFSTHARRCTPGACARRAAARTSTASRFMEAADIPLRGVHNVENTMAAARAAQPGRRVARADSPRP